MRYRMLRLFAACGLLAAFFPLLAVQPVAAAGVVGNGNPASCTEAAFDAALAGGGLVTFDCGPAQHTIDLTTEKVIANNTQIDGGDLIILDMNGNDRIFYVAPVATLRLDNIRIEDGFTDGDGGLIYNDGTVVANNVVFAGGIAQGNLGGGGFGGAVRNDGALFAADSTFTANLANACGGGLYNTGTSTISGDTLFVANRSDTSDGGGICNAGGTVQVQAGATFNSNVAQDGGAIANINIGSMTISGATFNANDASADGGAIFNRRGSMTVSNSTFSTNEALNSGGAISQGPAPINTLSITNSVFNLNTAGFQGGALHNEQQMSVTNTEFTFNHADSSGGAINNASGANLTVTRSSFLNNDADFRGGAIRNGGTATIDTSTISNNMALNQGGGVVNQDQMTITNSTIAFNQSGAPGGGIRNAGDGTLDIGNSIISNNDVGADCSNVGTFNSLDFNLDSDNSCPLGMANDISGGNANLQPLALNGGTTNNHLPGPGSDAIDAGPGACTSPDQRGEVRPQNGVCDIGAVEIVPPPDVCYNLWTGALQYPTSGSCDGPYVRGVVFEDNGPHYLCANPYTRALSYSYSATCPPYNSPAIVMPDAAPLPVCLNYYTGKYRLKVGLQPCSSGELATTLQ